MTQPPFDLDRMAAEAQQRLREFIARCAGQHLRRWRERWRSP